MIGIRCVATADQVRALLDIIAGAKSIPPVLGVSGQLAFKILANGSTVPRDILIEADGLIRVGGTFRKLSEAQLNRLAVDVSNYGCPWDVHEQLRKRGRTYSGPLFPRATAERSDMQPPATDAGGPDSANGDAAKRD